MYKENNSNESNPIPPDFQYWTETYPGLYIDSFFLGPAEFASELEKIVDLTDEEAK
jgi:hypothetical protein